MKTGIYLGIIVLFSIVGGVLAVNYFKQNESVLPVSTQNECKTDSECRWTITNCCPETAGAKWSCEITKTEQGESLCPKSVICPQVLSPRPNQTCACVQGTCRAE